MMIELTQEIVRKLLDYDPATGVLTWRQRDRKWFKNDHACNAWNARFSGQLAFTASHSKKREYQKGQILNRIYNAHRIIFLWMEGRWPDPEVDHENHICSDNRWVNLFEATHLQNSRNKSLPQTNTTGHIGVTWDAKKKKFRVRTTMSSGRLHLGYFDDLEKACTVRDAAYHKYGFHKNHGKDTNNVET